MDLIKIIAAIESAARNRCDSIRQSHDLKTVAVPENVLVQSLHRVRKVDVYQIVAAHKGSLADAGDCGGDLHVCQL